MCDLAAGLGGVSGWTCYGGAPTVGNVCSGSTSNWAGITCSSSNVVQISKSSSSLSGSLTSSIGTLISLASLSLPYNSIGGSIPTAIGLLTSLSHFDLGLNNLAGSIPTAIGLMTSLTRLHINHNKLTGSIPTTVGYLTSLIYFAIDINTYLTGTVPTQICLLSKLAVCNVYQSNLIACSTVCYVTDSSYCISGIIKNISIY